MQQIENINQHIEIFKKLLNNSNMSYSFRRDIYSFMSLCNVVEVSRQHNLTVLDNEIIRLIRVYHEEMVNLNDSLSSLSSSESTEDEPIAKTRELRHNTNYNRYYDYNTYFNTDDDKDSDYELN